MQVIAQGPRPITERTIRAFRRKSQVKRKVDPNRIRIFDISDEEIQRKIDEDCMYTDFNYALSYGFVPTSKYYPPSKHWAGKYKCMHCSATGYFWHTGPSNAIWWGYVHGIKCHKRVDPAV